MLIKTIVVILLAVTFSVANLKLNQINTFVKINSEYSSFKEPQRNYAMPWSHHFGVVGGAVGGAVVGGIVGGMVGGSMCPPEDQASNDCLVKTNLGLILGGIVGINTGVYLATKGMGYKPRIYFPILGTLTAISVGIVAAQVDSEIAENVAVASMTLGVFIGAISGFYLDTHLQDKEKFPVTISPDVQVQNKVVFSGLRISGDF